MISFKSEITQQILNYFFINPHESLYVNELARKLSLDKRNLVKKLKELEKEGILLSQSRGNLKLYTINQDFPLYNEYKNIILKTVGFEEELKELLNGIPGIEKAYIYGSYASDKLETHSDIDLLVIGEHSILSLQKAISKLQKKMGREINTINLDRNEYILRRKKKDTFLTNIFQGKIIELIS